MWTPTTRQQHSRTVTRYQTDPTDAEWRVIAPHLPQPCATGRPRAWPMREIIKVATLLAGLLIAPVRAQQPLPIAQPQPQTALSHVPPYQYSSGEIVDAGHHFFGGISKGIALVVQKAVDQWGEPNGYILGEEAGGAFIGGVRYGDSTLYTKMAVTYACSGRDQRSASMWEAMVRAPCCWCTTYRAPTRSTNSLTASLAPPTS